MGDISHDRLVLEAFLSAQTRAKLPATEIARFDQAAALQARLTRPPQVLVAGEFSSGKSTLANILVGADLMPTGVLATHLPVVEFGHGTQDHIQAAWWDSTSDLSFLGKDMEVLLATAPDFVRIQAPASLLRQVRIIDTPGTGDPAILKDAVHNVAKRADVLVWCTNAVQSWKESERQSWSQLPDRIRARSILLVTHMDLMAVKQNKDRIFNRLEKLVGDGFLAILPFAAPLAETAITAGEVTDKVAWRESGGEALIEHMLRFADAARDEAAHEARVFVADALGDLAPEPLDGADAAADPPLLTVWRAQATSLLHHLEAGTLEAEDRLRAATSGAIALLRAAVGDRSEVGEVLDQVEAHIGASSSADLPDRVLRALLQVGRELAHAPPGAT
ncbi:dynamin family protein [Actibacterium sp. 188UL27-1]|uniref:dynamin family protein n=1 Tax=Actibacterium sp. 188UL27-1 TaxID=2786961 RepID=UPI001956AD65|nr:dynamin family protein [Actibacterium sp. 188UL27-1]MBM7068696.1 dynamin family protein [Actibacterium sp. 188UL27-1]